MKPSGYLVIIEPTKTGFSAYCPDLPGCITVGDTVEETTRYMQEAMELYLEELLDAGGKLPVPQNMNKKITFLAHVQTGAYFTNLPA